MTTPQLQSAVLAARPTDLCRGARWREASGGCRDIKCRAVSLEWRLPTISRPAGMVRRLFADDLFSGWGIRTLATGMAAYNPLSYHNGSVWPHDNALIAAGLARYGFSREASRLIRAQLDASQHFESARIPELFRCTAPRG